MKATHFVGQKSNFVNETKRLARKVGFVLYAALFATLAGRATYAAEVSVGVAIHTESDFYEPLGSYGRWEVVGSYGRCWIPGGVEAGWSPYCNGYWQQTDAGWYWASNEPWGWATYHYGRWDLDPQFGWYWVPQTQWAPAWVSWREGGGYIGWCPLSPSGSGVVEVNVGGGAPRGYVFVQERQFLSPVNVKVVIANRAAINKTVINKGPDTVVIEKATGRKIQAVPVSKLRSQEEAKVVARHPSPASTSEKAVPTPVRNQAEKTLPAVEPRQVEKPVATTTEPQSPVTKPEVRQAEEPKRVEEAKPEAKPESKPDAKVEAKPKGEQPAEGREPTEQRDGKDGEK